MYAHVPAATANYSNVVAARVPGAGRDCSECVAAPLHLFVTEDADMKTGGKTITIGEQRRFFPAISPKPVLGALDSVRGLEDDDDRDDDFERDEEIDARERDLDMREAAKDAGRTDKAALDRKSARDVRALARDRRAHLRRARDRGDPGAAEDLQRTVYDKAAPAVDSKRSLAQDRALRNFDAIFGAGAHRHVRDFGEIFPTTAHAYRNHE